MLNRKIPFSIFQVNRGQQLVVAGAHLEFWRPRHKKFFTHFYHAFIPKILYIYINIIFRASLDGFEF
jgi:hypothetical protein